MFLTAMVRDENGVAVGVLVLRDKVFRTGREGYFGQGKLMVDGRRYQAQASLVCIEKGGDEQEENS